MEGILIAKYRETVCMYYEAVGKCKKGRDASHHNYCQKCDKYYPRAKVKHLNKKKQKIQEIGKNERY